MGNTIAKAICVLVITINVMFVWNLTEEQQPEQQTQQHQVTFDDIINADAAE